MYFLRVNVIEEDLVRSLGEELGKKVLKEANDKYSGTYLVGKGQMFPVPGFARKILPFLKYREAELDISEFGQIPEMRDPKGKVHIHINGRAFDIGRPGLIGKIDL